VLRKHAPVASHDPREEQEWFQRLPPHAQEELRSGWEAQRGKSEAQRKRARGMTARYLLEGAITFAAVEAVFTTVAPVHLLYAVAAGAVAGGVARALMAGAWLYGAIALVVYCFFSGLTLGLVGMTNAIVCVVLCTAAGRMHELQRSDGSE